MWRNHCWFAFPLWCGYCSMSIQPFVLRHLVIASILITKKLQFSRNKFMNIWHWQIPSDENNLGVFLAVAETIVGSLLCCSVGIVHCLFKSFALRHFVIATVCITKKLQFSRINLWTPPPPAPPKNYFAQYQVISNDHAYVLIRWGMLWNKSCFSITHQQWWSSNQLGKPSFCYLQYLFASFHWGEHFRNKEEEIVTVHNEQNHFNIA